MHLEQSKGSISSKLDLRVVVNCEELGLPTTFLTLLAHVSLSFTILKLKAYYGRDILEMEFWDSARVQDLYSHNSSGPDIIFIKVLSKCSSTPAYINFMKYSLNNLLNKWKLSLVQHVRKKESFSWWPSFSSITLLNIFLKLMVKSRFLNKKLLSG